MGQTSQKITRSESPVLAFTKDLPDNVYLAAEKYAREIAFGVADPTRTFSNFYLNNPESFYTYLTRGDHNGKSPYVDRAYSVQALAEYYQGLLKEKEFIAPYLLYNEAHHSLVKAIHNISDSEIGLKPGQVQAIAKIVAETYGVRAGQLYEDLQQDQAKGFQTAETNFLKMRGVHYALEKSGLDLKEDSTYKKLDDGLTLEKYNALRQQIGTKYAQKMYAEAQTLMKDSATTPQEKFTAILAARRALENSGLDMNSDATYKTLDKDMTKEKFDTLYKELQSGQGSVVTPQAQGPSSTALKQTA